MALGLKLKIKRETCVKADIKVEWHKKKKEDKHGEE